MSREEAIRMKAICYSEKFKEKFGDWLEFAKEYTELPTIERTETVMNELLKRYKVVIELDKNFEPLLTEEVLDFILMEYARVYGEYKDN